jgi:hypothetical protein
VFTPVFPRTRTVQLTEYTDTPPPDATEPAPDPEQLRAELDDTRRALAAFQAPPDFRNEQHRARLLDLWTEIITDHDDHGPEAVARQLLLYCDAAMSGVEREMARYAETATTISALCKTIQQQAAEQRRAADDVVAAIGRVDVDDPREVPEPITRIAVTAWRRAFHGDNLHEALTAVLAEVFPVYRVIAGYGDYRVRADLTTVRMEAARHTQTIVAIETTVAKVLGPEVADESGEGIASRVALLAAKYARADQWAADRHQPLDGIPGEPCVSGCGACALVNFIEQPADA